MLRRHDLLSLEHRITRLESEIRAAEQARALQAEVYEHRLAVLNESRAFERDAIARMVPRGEYDIAGSDLQDWRRSVEERLSRDSGARAALWSAFAVAVSIVAAISTIVGLFIGAR